MVVHKTEKLAGNDKFYLLEDPRGYSTGFFVPRNMKNVSASEKIFGFMSSAALLLTVTFLNVILLSRVLHT